MQSQPCLTLIPTQASAACSLVPGRAHRTCRLRARAAPAGPSAGRAARPPPGASAPRRAQSARWPALAAPASAPPPHAPARRRARRSGLCARAGARTSEPALDQAIRRGGGSATPSCPSDRDGGQTPAGRPKAQNRTSTPGALLATASLPALFDGAVGSSRLRQAPQQRGRLLAGGGRLDGRVRGARLQQRGGQAQEAGRGGVAAGGRLRARAQRRQLRQVLRAERQRRAAVVAARRAPSLSSSA